MLFFYKEVDMDLDGCEDWLFGVNLEMKMLIREIRGSLRSPGEPRIPTRRAAASLCTAI